MSRKKSEVAAGLADQAEAIRDVGDVATEGGAPAPDTNGEGKAKGPPRVNPPRYWHAIAAENGDTALIRSYRSLRSALKDWSGLVQTARMFTAGSPVVLKVKVAYPEPVSADPID